MDLYAVIGHPIAHSKSPWIHAQFAHQTGQSLRYEALLAPLQGFASSVAEFRNRGGRGLNVTVPFKLEAFELAQQHSERARAAGAVNTLLFSDAGMVGDNTDGAGLVRDLRDQLGGPLQGLRILLLGAGGAARGAVLPLLAEQPERLVIANRSADKAVALCAFFRDHAGAHSAPAEHLSAARFDALEGMHFDVIINATSASLGNALPAIPATLFAPSKLVYDMMYGAGETAFNAHARTHGAPRCADGLGMLVEQAAESFLLWRGVRPDTAPVLAQLRQLLEQG